MHCIIGLVSRHPIESIVALVWVGSLIVVGVCILVAPYGYED
jgi:hypothetical protein